jgi:hypothetical protein
VEAQLQCLSCSAVVQVHVHVHAAWPVACDARCLCVMRDSVHHTTQTNRRVVQWSATRCCHSLQSGRWQRVPINARGVCLHRRFRVHGSAHALCVRCFGGGGHAYVGRGACAAQCGAALWWPAVARGWPCVLAGLLRRGCAHCSMCGGLRQLGVCMSSTRSASHSTPNRSSRMHPHAGSAHACAGAWVCAALGWRLPVGEITCGCAR